MATIRLIPSTYAVSSTTYLSVSNASNMYHNIDNTTYATITNTYIYGVLILAIFQAMR